MIFDEQVICRADRLVGKITEILGSCEVARVWNEDRDDFDDNRLVIVMLDSGWVSTYQLNQLAAFLRIESIGIVEVAGKHLLNITAKYGYEEKDLVD